MDADFEARRKELEAQGLRWRFVAKMEEGKTSVSLETVDATHPFYQGKCFEPEIFQGSFF